MRGPQHSEVWRLAESMQTEPHDANNVVYFARCHDGLIKIGTTGNVWARLGQLGHPELLGVEPGGYKLETRRHRQFAGHQAHGEYFHPGDDLLAHIAESCTLPEPPAREPAAMVPTPDRLWDMQRQDIT